jgi:post-segregation antitoxin (ccd killing protein)
MATLEQLGEAITEQLRERVERLVSAVEDDAQDFTAIANVADSVAEFADTVGDIYTDLERRLLGGLEGSDGEQPLPAQSESADDDVTKEELLEQARDLHVEGRSSMTKEELAQAVEAEESVTKDELLERARVANIEGRSSMTKEELRDALHEAGA